MNLIIICSTLVLNQLTFSNFCMLKFSRYISHSAVCETHGDSGAYIRSINVIIYKSEQGEEESERMHADVIWVETPYLAKRISGAS